MDSSNILSYLSNPSKTTDDIRIVHSWFKRNTDVFKDLTVETMTEILNAAKIVEKYPNEVIIRQGDIGDCFFILLKGAASLYINNDSSTKDEPSEHAGTTSHSKLTRSARTENAQKSKLESKRMNKDVDRKTYGAFIQNYNEGGCFGEMALIQEDNIRNASIIANEKCHLLSISKELFDKAIRSYTENVYKEKINFVNTHILFKNWQPKIKQQLAISLVKMNVYFDQDIIVQGQPSTGLILIKKGTAKVTIDIKQHYAQYSTYLAQLERGESTIQDSHVPSRDDLKTAQSCRETSNKFRRDKIEIAIIGINDIIGDIEFGFNFPTNLLTISAMGMCEVYILKNVHVERMISFKRNVSTLEILQDIAEIKINAYYNRCLTFEELPLMKLLLTEINMEGEMINLKDHFDKQSQKISLLPIFKSGPIIDFYGPGSVFFRNRLKRKIDKEKQSKIPRVNQVVNKNLKINTYSDQISVSKSQNLNEIQIESRKPIFQSHNKKNTFIDWETSSLHLNDLETRIQSWMTTFGIYRNTKIDSPSEKEVLRLPRFQYEELSEDCRFIVKYKRSPTENNDNVENRINSRKEEDCNFNDNGKKIGENLVRQYTELEYFKLKEEMKMKEKKLSIFRLKHAL